MQSYREFKQLKYQSNPALQAFPRTFRVVVPSGIEPLPTASEAIVLSIGPRDQCACAEAGMRNGPCGTWQGKDFDFSMSDAVPGGPEGGRLGGVRDDFQQQGFVPGLELVEIIHRADAEVVHAPERGETG